MGSGVEELPCFFRIWPWGDSGGDTIWDCLNLVTEVGGLWALVGCTGKLLAVLGIS